MTGIPKHWTVVTANEGDDDECVFITHTNQAVEVIGPPKYWDDGDWELNGEPITPAALRELADLIEAEEAKR